MQSLRLSKDVKDLGIFLSEEKEHITKMKESFKESKEGIMIPVISM